MYDKINSMILKSDLNQTNSQNSSIIVQPKEELRVAEKILRSNKPCDSDKTLRSKQ